MTSSKYTTRARMNSVVRARVAVMKADRVRGIEIRRRKGRMKIFDRFVDHIFLPVFGLKVTDMGLQFD